MDGTLELEVQVELHPHMVVPDGTQAEDVELRFPDELDDASPAAKEPDQIVEQGGLVDLRSTCSKLGGLCRASETRRSTLQQRSRSRRQTRARARPRSRSRRRRLHAGSNYGARDAVGLPDLTGLVQVVEAVPITSVLCQAETFAQTLARLIQPELISGDPG